MENAFITMLGFTHVTEPTDVLAGEESIIHRQKHARSVERFIKYVVASRYAMQGTGIILTTLEERRRKSSLAVKDINRRKTPLAYYEQGFAPVMISGRFLPLRTSLRASFGWLLGPMILRGCHTL